MSLPHAPRVTLLGPDIDHRASLEAMLRGHAEALSWMPDSSCYFHDRPATAGRRLRRALDQFRGTQDPIFREALVRHLDAHHTDVVIAYWGTNPLADLVAIRQLRPRIRLVLMVLCYPLSLDPIGVARQHWLIRRAARHLDGVLFPSEAMRGHFHAHRLLADAPQPIDELILPPCWPASFQQTGAQPQAASDAANLIFVGRTDLSHPTIHAADDLREPMQALLDAGIELHHVRSPETSDGHPLRRPFEPATQPELLRRMAGHDASLIMYNTGRCRRADRFDLTVPDRMISSVAAGVPIALPAQGYRASKAYLAKYPALIEFTSIADLARQLADREQVAALRHAAWEARRHYAAEVHGADLTNFLSGLVGRGRPARSDQPAGHGRATISTRPAPLSRGIDQAA